MGDLTKDEEKLVPLLKGLRFLIADPTSSRKSFRALLSEFSVKPDQIEVVENTPDAFHVLEGKTPHVIFAEYSIGAQACFEFVRIQNERLDPAAVRAVFLVTTQDSNSLVTSAATESIDAVIIKPFSFGALKERFLQVLTEKLAPTPYVTMLNKGRTCFKNEQLDEALAIFRKARALDPKPSLALAYEAETLQTKKLHQEALSCYIQALQHNPTHFRSLLGSFDSFIELGKNEEAYEAARKLAQHHTIPAKRIPDMIRISITTQHFEDLVGFYQTAGDLSVLDDTIASHLGAGLVICGLHFLKRGNKSAAIDAFRKAEVASKQNTRILMRILQALISAGLESEMKSFMSRVPDEVRNSPDVQLAEIEFLNKAGQNLQALEQCLRLIKQGTKLERVYEIAIRVSTDMKRKETLIEELVFRAGNNFPEKKAFFESLIGRTQSS